MIPFTCELNLLNIAGGVPSPATTGLLSEAQSWNDATEWAPGGSSLEDVSTSGALVLTHSHAAVSHFMTC